MTRDKKMEELENELVKKTIKGDDLAFEELLGKYLKPVYGFLHQLIKDPAQVDDVAQETFIKVWKNLSKFDQKRSFKTWLFTIAKNNALDYFKKKKITPFSFFEDNEGNNWLDEISEDAVLPDEMMERVDLENEMEKTLKKIPEKYRIILIMHYKEDFSLHEISDVLGAPYNTVKAYHSRALFLLKKAFLGE